MKADVVPAKPPQLDIPSWVPDAIAQWRMKADGIPPQLDIPSWVPDVIVQSVSARYADDVDRIYKVAPVAFAQADMTLEYFVKIGLAGTTKYYLPLTCDLRMESVWRELAKRDSNGGFLHRAIGIDQDTALLQLFDVAVRAGNKTTKLRQRSVGPSSSVIIISPRQTSCGKAP